MSNKADRFIPEEKPKHWRPYLSGELKTELDEFFAEHGELDPVGSITSWIRRGASEYRRKHPKKAVG